MKVLLAKVGLDGHDRGIKVIARALRDAGIEVVLGGMRMTPEQVAEAAVQEDVDAIGLSSLSGAHLQHFPRVADALRKADRGEVLLFCGGIIPPEDRTILEETGYRGIFEPGTPLEEIVDFLRTHARESAG